MKKWQRLGLVLSVIWVIYSFVKTRNSQVEFATESAQFYLNSCLDSGYAIDKCNSVFSEKFKSLIPVNYEILLWDAFFPLVTTWLLIWLSISTYKWIMRGK